MTNQSLILLDHAGQSAAATDAARQLIDEALTVGALIGSVRNADENEAAVRAQTALKTVEKQIEGAYRAAKDPIVRLGRNLDTIYKDLISELAQEYGRIGNLAAQFALAENRRLAAERIAQQEAIDKLEREKHAAIAATPDPVKQVQVIVDFSRRAETELPLPSAPVRAPGQKVREDWQIEPIDLVQFARWVLMSGRWECLHLEVNKTAVKELLKGGMKEIPGLKCDKKAQAGVTLPREQKTIDV